MELKRVIEDSEIMEEDDALWPPPDRVGRQVSICRMISLCRCNACVCNYTEWCKTIYFYVFFCLQIIQLTQRETLQCMFSVVNVKATFSHL